jgi:putative tryptophan/tyrosine transport system substrate-binding protein
VFLLADAIGTGIVTNLRRPGGNITGASIYRPAEKYPEIAKQVLPGLTRVGYLFNPMTASSAVSLSEARHSAECSD